MLTLKQAKALNDSQVTQAHLILHAKNVMYAMGAMAEHFGENREHWMAVGYLHDYDYEKYPEEHLRHTEQPLLEAGVPAEDVRAILSHGWGSCSDVKPETLLEKSLFTVDELTGIIQACARMRPRGITDLETKSFLKKFKDKKFAAKCSREIILQGCEMLGLSVSEVAAICIEGMKPYGAELELLGTEPRITAEDYLRDPCGASSLSFWKSEQLEIPENLSILREDQFAEVSLAGKDTPYFGRDTRFFKMIHSLQSIPRTELPPGYQLTSAGPKELTDHIQECYQSVDVTLPTLEAYTESPVYDEALWIAVREEDTGRIVASGIAELDQRIGEGILDWIQVSRDHRGKGFGKFVVCELLRRLSKKADFVTVSGQKNTPNNAFALYQACGFDHPVIWHILVRVPERRK